MGSFRSIIVEVFLGLCVMMVLLFAIRSARGLFLSVWQEIKALRLKKRRDDIFRDIDEMLGRFDKEKLEQVALEFRRRELRKSRQLSLRTAEDNRIRSILNHGSCLLDEDEDTFLIGCSASLREMNREALLKLISLYMEEIVDEQTDPVGAFLEIVDSGQNQAHPA